MPSLVVLDLANNRLQSEDLHVLGSMLNAGRFQLQRLSLWGNDLGFDGACVLAQYLEENCSLFSVDISSNSICDHGFERVLTALQRNMRTRVRWVGSDNNELTSVSVVKVATALRKTERQAPLRSIVFSMLGNQLHSASDINRIVLPLPVSSDDGVSSTGWPLSRNVIV